MTEYFELYRILEDGEIEHIDQIRIRNKNIFQTLYDNFQELQDYVNTTYCNIYDIELKKYLMNTDIGNEYVIKHFSAAHKDINIKEDESIEVRKISSLQYRKFDKYYDNQYQITDYNMKNTVLWRRHIPDSVFEECIWCDDDPELWERAVDGQLDILFWSRS